MVKVVKSPVARSRQIHLRAAQQLEEQLGGNGETTKRIVERGQEPAVPVVAFERTFQTAAPFGEQSLPGRAISRAIVGNVVGMAQESVDGAKSPAPLFRQGHKRVVENASL